VAASSAASAATYRRSACSRSRSSQLGESAVVVLSYDYWQNGFGGDEGVVGRTLTVNGQQLVVIGVAPAGFRGTIVGLQPRVYVPITMRWLVEPWRPRDENDRRSHWVYMLARLQPAVPPEQALASINTVYGSILNEVEAPLNSSMAADELEQFRNKRIRFENGGQRRGLLRNDNAEPLTMLLGITALVLMIVCVNIGNLLLVRGAARAGEMAIRATMGASRCRLVTESLIDVGVVAVIGGIASLPVAGATLSVIGAMLPEQVAATMSIELSPAALWFAAGVSLCTVLVFGAAPAAQAARTDPGVGLKRAFARAGGSRSMLRIRNSLATVQIAFSTVLLVLGGLFALSLTNIARVDLGLDVESVVTFTISPRSIGHSSQRSMATFDSIEERLAAEPGVSGVGSSRIALLASRGWTNSASEFTGFPNAPATNPTIGINAVSSGFLSALSIPVLMGRAFSTADTASAPRVAVVNESFVGVFGLGDGAVGARFNLGSNRPDIEIVGVIADTKYSGVTDEIPPTVFLPRQQERDLDGLTYYVRGLDVGTLLRTIPRVVAEVDAEVPVTDLRTLARQAANDVYRARLIATLSASFAALATLLAAIGLYGVLAYNVAQRTRELGLRQALGAKPAELRVLVLKHVGIMAAVGTTIGLVAAVGLGRLAESLLFGLSGNDPVILFATVAAIAVVVFAASYVPARRASSIAPMEALRHE
jgi:predicted permease